MTPSPAPSSRPGLGLYLAVAFGFSWAIAAVAFLVEPTPIARVGLYLVFMWGPALGAVVAQRAAGQAVLAPLGVTLTPNRWWLAAWLVPFAVSIAAGLVGALMPGVEPAAAGDALLSRLGDTLPPDELAKAQQQLASVPPPALLLIMLLQALVAAVSVNLVATFGEELGWRGYLHQRFAHLGFWRRSVVVGVVWGIWHAPIILMGHNYPQHPVVGVFFMIVFTTLLAPGFELVRSRGGSVVAACVCHGAVNASAGFGIAFLKGGSDLVVGVTGLAGFIVLAVVNLLIWRIDGAQRSPAVDA